MTEPHSDVPLPDIDNGDGGGDSEYTVHVSVYHTGDETQLAAQEVLPTANGVPGLSAALLHCLLGVAAMHGSELQVELARQFLPARDETGD